MRIIRSGGEAAIVRGGHRSSASSTTDLELPELRLDSVSSVTVRLSRTSREAMRDEAFRLTGSDDRECGGFLLAPVARSWDRTVEITHATTTGNAIRRNGGMTMDTSRLSDAERWVERNGWHDEALAGIFHTHPGEIGRDAGRPSDADLKALLSIRDWAHKTRGACNSVGLILTMGRAGSHYGAEYSWATPELHAWLTRRTPTGTPVTEWANVEGWR